MTARAPDPTPPLAEHLARALEDATGEAVIVVDVHDAITRWSPAAQRMFGHGPGEAIGRRAGELLALPLRGDGASVMDALRGGEPWAATSDLGKAGEHVVWSAALLGDEAGAPAGAIYRARRAGGTDRAPAPTSLAARAIADGFEQMQENATILDRQFRVVAMNARARADAERAIGRPLRVGDDIRAASPPGHEANFEQYARAAFRGERSAFSLRLRYPNGESFLFAFEFTPLAVDGEIVAVLFGAFPLAAQSMLAERLARVERGLAGARVALVVADARLPDMPLVYASEAIERLSGYPVAEVLGKNARMFAGAGDDRGAREVLRRALSAGEPCDVLLPNRRKDGAEYWARVTITPVRDEQGAVSHFVGIQEDASLAVQMEERLRAALETERRCEMLAGIVHDLRNTLMVISGQIAALSCDAEHEDALETLDVARVAVNQAAGLTRLLGGAPGGDLVAEGAVRISALGRGISALVRFVLPAEITFVVAPLPDDAVRGAAERLEQVLLNLVLNARDALPHGGTIQLDATRDAPPGARVAAGAGAPWTIRVTDDGEGMAPATLARVFEPHFTTKPAGRGSGLGLPMCLETVRALGGDLLVESELGAGTTVSVVLPEAAAAAEASESRAIDARVVVGLDVLLFVPDVSVRTVIGTMLRQRGALIHGAGDVTVAGELERALGEEAVLLVDASRFVRGASDFLRRWLAASPRRHAVLIASEGDEVHPRVVRLPLPFGYDELVRALAGMLPQRAR